jgi:hypothetical protein
MLSKLKSKPKRTGASGRGFRTGRWALASAIVLALGASSFAFADGEGNPVKGGKRNPFADQTRAYTSETQIIANNSTYGTRQSNKGTGGGAIYGCRSAPKAPSCLRASNLNQGLAFSFDSDGTLAGVITTAKGGDGSQPFVTNATGVATGLNADRVDSKNADDLTKDAVAAVQGTTPFVQVAADGKPGANRGVKSVARTAEGSYNVLFDNDISQCALQVTEATSDNGGAASFSVADDKKTVTVVTRAGGDGATDADQVADRPFHLTATC